MPMSKGALANAKFGYCAGGEEAQAALGSAAMPRYKERRHWRSHFGGAPGVCSLVAQCQAHPCQVSLLDTLLCARQALLHTSGTCITLCTAVML